MDAGEPRVSMIHRNPWLGLKQQGRESVFTVVVGGGGGGIRGGC